MKNELIAMQKSESEKLLDECRELFTHRMSSSMTRMMEYIEDVLIKMAKPDKNKEVLLHFIEAAEVLRSKKHENHARFENRFNSLYHNSVYKMNTGVSSHHFTSEDIESNFERDINESGDSVKIKKTLNNARDKCRSALSVLDNHVNDLFEKEEINKIVNTMQPASVFGAFWESCREIRTNADIRFILVEMFERIAVTDLNKIYVDLNNLFGFYQENRKLKAANSINHKFNAKNIDSGNKNYEEVLNQNSLLVRNWVNSRVKKHIKKMVKTESVRLLRSSAKHGDPIAQFQLGELFYHGLAVNQDYAEAALWYRRGAEQGDVDAQFSLGNMYLLGVGMQQNDIQARYWYSEAAEQGHSSAKHNLDNIERFSQNNDLITVSTIPTVQVYEVPEFIHQFLIKSWTLVLANIYEKHGEKSHEWDCGLEIIDELIRWTQFANDKEIETSQIWMLSGLVHRLKIGMDSISLATSIQADFLSILKLYKIQTTELKH